jgi:hypothetical protein
MSGNGVFTFGPWLPLFGKERAAHTPCPFESYIYIFIYEQTILLITDVESWPPNGPKLSVLPGLERHYQRPTFIFLGCGNACYRHVQCSETHRVTFIPP